jgi:hypothetical protein
MVYTLHPMKIMIPVLLAVFLYSSLVHGAETIDINSGSDKFVLPLNSAGTQQNKEQRTPALQNSGSAAPILPMAQKDKFHFYLKTTFGSSTLLMSAASAGIRQAKNSIPEWGQGMEGYGKRFGSSYGQRVINHSIVFGLESILHEDPRYHKSESSGVWRRAFHAVGQSFISHKDSGGIRPGYTSFIGIAGEVYISRQWYPARTRTTANYFEDGAISFGADIARNILREFWPDVKKGF